MFGRSQKGDGFPPARRTDARLRITRTIYAPDHEKAVSRLRKRYEDHGFSVDSASALRKPGHELHGTEPSFVVRSSLRDRRIAVRVLERDDRLKDEDIVHLDRTVRALPSWEIQAFRFRNRRSLGMLLVGSTSLLVVATEILNLVNGGANVLSNAEIRHLRLKLVRYWEGVPSGSAVKPAPPPGSGSPLPPASVGRSGTIASVSPPAASATSSPEEPATPVPPPSSPAAIPTPTSTGSVGERGGGAIPSAASPEIAVDTSVLTTLPTMRGDNLAAFQDGLREAGLDDVPAPAAATVMLDWPPHQEFPIMVDPGDPWPDDPGRIADRTMARLALAVSVSRGFGPPAELGVVSATEGAEIGTPEARDAAIHAASRSLGRAVAVAVIAWLDHHPSR